MDEYFMFAKLTDSHSVQDTCIKYLSMRESSVLEKPFSQAAANTARSKN